MRRPGFAAWTVGASIKAALVIGGGHASLISWIAVLTVGAVLWIEEPRLYAAADQHRLRWQREGR